MLLMLIHSQPIALWQAIVAEWEIAPVMCVIPSQLAAIWVQIILANAAMDTPGTALIAQDADLDSTK